MATLSSSMQMRSCSSRAFRDARPHPLSPQRGGARRERSALCKAYVEPSVTFAVTQQALAFAAVLAGDAVLEKDSKSVAPDLKIVGAGAGATVAAVAILNTGIDALATVGLVLGTLSSAAMLAYHIKRTIDAKDDDADWPGPKALPGTIALISFFALNVFVQGIRAEL